MTFEIDPFKKHCLLNGLDGIGLTEQKAEQIAAYENETRSLNGPGCDA